MVIECKPADPTKQKCPYFEICVARLNDPTVAGCGMALFMDGFIEWDDIEVLHRVNVGGEEIAIYQLEENNGKRRRRARKRRDPKTGIR